MKRKRLEHLITVLEQVPAVKFNMASWADTGGLPKPAKCKLPDNFVEIKCSTVCCAAGWAALDKTFIKQGLRVVMNNEPDPLTATTEWAQSVHRRHGTMMYKKLADYEALEAFFGLDRQEVEYLFDESAYSDELGEECIITEDVIYRIKRLLRS